MPILAPSRLGSAAIVSTASAARGKQQTVDRGFVVRGTAVGGYAGRGSFRLFLGFLRGCDSRSSGLSMPAIMPVATRV
jgi:hypothetical protein